MGLEVVPSCLHFLGEGEEIGRGGQVPLLGSPESAGGSSSGLDLIYNEGSIVVLSNLLQLLEEVGGGMVISSFALHRLYNDGCHRTLLLPGQDSLLCLLQTTIFLCPVLPFELI